MENILQFTKQELDYKQSIILGCIIAVDAASRLKEWEWTADVKEAWIRVVASRNCIDSMKEDIYVMLRHVDTFVSTIAKVHFKGKRIEGECIYIKQEEAATILQWAWNFFHLGRYPELGV